MNANPASHNWDPQQYLQFADQRLRPALELRQRIPLSPNSEVNEIVDLGCGTGQLTCLLAQR